MWSHVSAFIEAARRRIPILALQINQLNLAAWSVTCLGLLLERGVNRSFQRRNSSPSKVFPLKQRVIYLIIFLMEDDISVDSKVFFDDRLYESQDKSTQFFKVVHKDMICVHVFIRMSDHTYMNICVYNVFQK
jgi:hypothetical protein